MNSHSQFYSPSPVSPLHYKTPRLGPRLGPRFGFGPSLGEALVAKALGKPWPKAPPRFGGALVVPWSMETHQGIFLCCINQHYIYICSAVTGESRPKIDRFVSVGRFVSVRVARTFLVACTFASLVCSMASKVVRIWLPASCIHMYVLISRTEGVFSCFPASNPFLIQARQSTTQQSE